MSEEVKNEEPKEEQKQSEGGLPYQGSEKKAKDIERNLAEIELERKEKDEMRRFGYFSIPYPAVVGDQAYSQTKEYPNHKVVDRKVIIEKRGVYTMGPKSGKTNDAYFSVLPPYDDEELKQQKEAADKERTDYINQVKARKEQRPKNPFVPAGVKNMFAYYNGNENTAHEGTLTIEPDKKRFIMEGYKVKTELPNIKTSPTKVGTSFSPNDYFDFCRSDDAVQQRLAELGKKDIQDKIDKVKYNKANPVVKAPFKPASLKKNDPFFSDGKTYGIYNDDEINERMKEYKDFKKNGYPKYQKVLPKGALKHDGPFRPARLKYEGRDGLFNDDLYKIPEVEPVKMLSVKERKAIEEADKKKRMPFTYNKLMKSSTFSPPISSFTTNLRREFPTIKFH